VAVVAYGYDERPELWEQIEDLSAEVWPEYNRHGEVLSRYWGRLYEVFPEYQFVLYDEAVGEVLAEGQTVPVAWDGTDDGLGPGIDASIAGAFATREAGGPAGTLCALAAEIRRRHQGRGLSVPVLTEMAARGRRLGLDHLIAPVRPNHKDRYPIIPIEQYAGWTDADGEPFDPWLRVHHRLGGRIARTVPKSLRITGTVADWEGWTGLRYPQSGLYVFPEGLAPLLVDTEHDVGTYFEPNVWVVHSTAPVVGG